MLKTIARRLESVVRASDTVARVGGDEFVVLSLDAGNEQEAAALVGRLRHALRGPTGSTGAMIEIDASIGWALFPTDGATPDELLARADGQMYATKRETGEATPRPTRRRGRARVRAALERREVVVHYQPVLELSATGACGRSRRWSGAQHPGRGVILSPPSSSPTSSAHL